MEAGAAELIVLKYALVFFMAIMSTLCIIVGYFLKGSNDSLKELTEGMNKVYLRISAIDTGCDFKHKDVDASIEDHEKRITKIETDQQQIKIDLAINKLNRI